MEPRIQYAKTSDGVSIAYWTMGKGMPLVGMPQGFSHIQLEWQFPEVRVWYQRLAEERRLIRYDWRGFGLSERDVTDRSFEAHVSDVEALVDHLGLERFDLFGSTFSGAVAVAYAARHPDRVSHLLLWGTWCRPSDYLGSPKIQALVALRSEDWEVYSEAAAHVMCGWSEGEAARRYAALIRESIAQEAMLPALAAVNQADVWELLPQVRAPTLVLHRRQFAWLDVDVARGLASRIPDARLALLEGESTAPYLGDTEAVLTAIDEFLSEGEVAPANAPPPAVPGVVTIIFTDMESSTALTQQLGDAAAQEVRRTHNEIVRAALQANGGSEIKHTGDGIMASFATASSAVECAIAIQRGVAAHVEEHPDSPLGLYIGLNAGEPIAEEGDLFGTSINLAARICDHAEPGQILASNVVRELAAGKDFLFADIGEIELRGFEDPVKLWEVRWQGED